MQVLDLDSIGNFTEQTAVALGMFDGVHLGHQKVIHTACKYAAKNKLKTAAITLKSHPRQLTEGKAPPLLTDLETRLKIFQELGIDYCLVLDFDNKLMETSAQDYLDQFLEQGLNAKFIALGYDHHFGKNRQGNAELLESWCKDKNIDLEITPAFYLQDEIISSSIIRKLVQEGKLHQASKLLGRAFQFTSTVIEGNKLGRELGFPTANLELIPGLVLPPTGVYCGKCKLVDQEASHQCAINLGYRPSVNKGQVLNLEVHIINFNEEIYGAKLTLEFHKKIRDEISFANLDELKQQISKDIELCMN